MAAHIALNKVEFGKCCRLLKLSSNAAIGRFIGMGDAQVGRVLKNDRAPGADFIAAVLNAFGPYGMKFEELFVIEVDEVCGDETGETAA